jgi:hypothetical protein
MPAAARQLRRWRQRESGRRRQLGGSAAVAAHSATVTARWLRRWRQRDIVTSAAAWRWRATGDDNEDDDDGDGDGAMGSGATGYDDDGAMTMTTTTMVTARRAKGYDDGRRQWQRTMKTTRLMATARWATARRAIMATTTTMVMGDGR